MNGIAPVLTPELLVSSSPIKVVLLLKTLPFRPVLLADVGEGLEEIPDKGFFA